jgi:hypothetical protein
MSATAEGGAGDCERQCLHLAGAILFILWSPSVCNDCDVSVSVILDTTDTAR